MFNKSSDIQTLLEELSAKEEARSIEVKQKYDILSQKLTEQNMEIPSLNSEITIGDELTLKCMTAKKKTTVIRTSGTIDDFIGNVKIGYGSECPHKSSIQVGYRDDSGRIVYLRTTQDLTYLYKWYFAQEPSSVPVVILSEEETELFKKFNFRRESLNKDGQSAIFRCEAGGPDKPLILIAIPNLNYNDGKKFLDGIFQKVSTIMFVDEAEDMITVDSQESWDYFMETGMAMTKTGNYPLLILQTA
ncbi:hypothetical protein TVAG_484390 [Trichomonas vaginalis G3]|uniref:Uncharacterized protein n=1 Tax=Trichomonas vaginalis (strain ATCC PRA-98 / G3) TaxID=412133 RepID=A2FUJ2_TRIV3|nr:hypothetical protein TVAGG3_0947010 [Trichomonas vaginalis G3]EAX91425.1 hypothetical protein TVAG_484390 [Trichomonas vaginalis G3]KAI5486946.1 hypothetical protein TVAGG3_0947010 [Trichomonas vaginalis G3]|eukprot:XP_001304355.1 hypothetical protein [Trichomonas vaginalis G3]